MTTTIKTGSYPQISDKFTLLNSKKWNEKTLEKHSHRLLEIRLKEITFKSCGKTRSYNDMNTTKSSNNPLRPLIEKQHALKGSTFRVSIQDKSTLMWDMTKISVADMEACVRKVVANFGARDPEKIPLVIQTMITEKNGYKCWWAFVDKKFEGQKMILAKVDNKPFYKLSKQERADAMDMTWCEEICDIKVKEVKVTRTQMTCDLSGAVLTQ